MREKKGNKDYPVDVVVTWVDGGDREWQESRNRFIHVGSDNLEDSNEERYRDWETLKYFFRSIEMYAPWVRRIHLVTCGHIPEWLNVESPRLNLVRHDEFMDQRYLPTFSSHAIELNIHRIPGLAERFIYFNDDTMVSRKTSKKDFFKNGVPVDFAVICPLISRVRLSMMDTELSNVEIINAHFQKNEVIKQSAVKWINPKYGRELIKTLLMMPFGHFSAFQGNHFPHAYLKSTFETVWKEEGQTLDEVSCRKFRTRRDPNHWLIREWQLVSGEFCPGKAPRGKYILITDDKERLQREFDAVEREKPLMICVNDSRGGHVEHFEETKEALTALMDRLYPHKSSYEL